MDFKTEKSITSGKTYVPSKVNISSKNGLYEVQTYNPTIDPFEKKKTNTLSEPTDPFKQKTGYSPTRTTDDITKRKIEDYQGHKYDTFYDYGFPNDKDKEKRKQEPKEPKPKSEPKVDRKPKHVERAESPFPYNASKSVSRTFMLMTKGQSSQTRGNKLQNDR
ncbi:Hypothetical predicted protein [Mytilus galloprovincialis]|uniref:Uncharacterized protein n=1 Tax=Mytilus galloprovincialis TaxID=29158 RepID=A0A8B6DD12_MYTGA|nr:Hypothetical predicted protein [Mytilus galloprovincialis]